MATPLMFTFLILMLFHAADDDFATNSVDSSSSSTWPHCPSDEATPVDATPSIGRSSSDSSLRTRKFACTDIIDEESDRPVHGAGSPSKPNAIATPKPLGTVAGQYRPLFVASSQPPSLEESRAPKRTNTVKVRRHESLLMNAHLNAPDANKKTITSEKEGG
ncbi:uncharacterized protein PAC_19550 [Phialocephala subalpina]|uniref:Uncharacterized protein n=1 Tax=Phialocephala subalpina TaxID=576137 RepID=A0A1L7XXC3_9HELO|nr:uncharacterized protein PAC_19550 [Phialocephala subalpina]